MAIKTLRTSGDYLIKTGTGSGGSNTITFDSNLTVVNGNLEIKGTQSVINSTTLTIEDRFLEINRNNSTAGTQDSGLMFNQGTSNNAILYYDVGDNEFQLGTTTHDAAVTTVSNITLGQIKIATTPSDNNHAASKKYVDDSVTGGGFILNIGADDSTEVTYSTGQKLQFLGGSNISTAITTGDNLTISLGQNLTNIESISSATSNANLTLASNGTGDVVINDTLTFSGAASTPTAGSVTKIYNKTAGGGGTGLYFNNSAINSGTEDELISKKKATALAIALG